MGKPLNKRVRNIRIAAVFCVILALFGQPTFSDESIIHHVLDALGNILVTLCIVGRVFTTAFVGGQKNRILTTYGAYSLCRNPLYFFSFLGAIGVAFMSSNIILILFIPVFFLIVFFGLIKKEEVYLRDKFGAEFDAYCATTPRFFPDVKRYTAPETVQMVPYHLLDSVRDASLWLIAMPFFEFVEYVQSHGIITPYF